MEAKEIPQISISSKILNLQLIECTFEKNVPVELVTKMDREKVQFEFNFGIRTDIVKKTVNVTLTTNFFADESKSINLGRIITGGEFEITNMDEVLGAFDGKLPNLIFANFVGVVIGTTRGFLITNAKGSVMEGIYLPMIHPLTLFPQNLETKNT